jgi:hypothetical protein
MKKNSIFAAITSTLACAVAVFAFVSCGDDTTTPAADSGPDSSMPETSVTADTGSDASETGVGEDAATDAEAGADAAEAGPTLPAPPTLGTQIDRMGRPAINTALNHTFDPDPTATGVAKDAYNADSNLANWSTYAAQFKTNLAIYDGLDGVCGNQAAFGSLTNPDYVTLSKVLAQDELWLDSSVATCSTYLAVELSTLAGTPDTDCGGRTLTENVIDFTYNALAGTYTLPPAQEVTNGVTAPASLPTTTFPYLAAPH